MSFLSLITLIILLFLIIAIMIKQYLRNHKIAKYRDPRLKIMYIIKIILLILISILISLTFSNYKGGQKKVNNYSMLIDNIIIIDYSTSMLANDIHPNRFEQSKILSLYILDNLSNCRYALILFGDDPLLEVPLTDNILLLKEVISSIQINEDIYRSSNISLAIDTAIELLDNSPAIYKNIIIFSDFDFDQFLSNKMKDLIKDKITYLFNIVISSEKGSKIWLPDKNNFLMDKFQNEVFSSTNKLFLSDISKIPNSIISYWDNISYNSISAILNTNKNLSYKMEKHETVKTRELNYLFAVICLIFMFFYLIIFSNIFNELSNKIFKKFIKKEI